MVELTALARRWLLPKKEIRPPFPVGGPTAALTAAGRRK